MKKFSLLILLVLCVTIGGVYATWAYAQNPDVADEQIHMTLNLTEVENAGSYGAYKIDTSGLTLAIDPKEGTTHVTALKISGQIVITFTPNAAAPETVKKDAVPSTFQFTLTNSNWVYEGEKIFSLTHTDAEQIDWGTADEKGVFTFIITAEELTNHFNLTEFTLDTKAKYDSFNTALGQGQITITVSDGKTSTQPQN